MTYIAAAYTCPVYLDEDVVRGFEFWDGALFVFDFERGFKDKGKVLVLGISIGNDCGILSLEDEWLLLHSTTPPSHSPSHSPLPFPCWSRSAGCRTPC